MKEGTFWEITECLANRCQEFVPKIWIFEDCVDGTTVRLNHSVVGGDED